LTITTVIAFFLAFNKGMDVIPGFVGPDIISTSSIFFLIALMGWMPAPIEVSVWTSLWALGRSEQVSYKPTLRESLIDFHIGYIGTAILAVLFLSLGAFIMYGSGLPFSPNGTKFSTQLIHLYTTLFGQWSAYVIAPAAFLTIFSSLLSVMDGYPRTYDASIQTLKLSIAKPKLNMFFVFIVALVITAIIIIIFFTKSMAMMIDMATIISFLAAPIFAFLNFKIVTQKDFPDGFKPPQWLRVLSYFGIIFLSVFSLIYLFTLFFVSL